MALWSPSDRDLLLAHVTDQEAVIGYISTFVLAVREARVLTGRDAGSGGQIVPYEQVVTKWTGTVTYLILLEQVGKSLRPLGARKAAKAKGARPKEYDVECAIRQFAPGMTTQLQRQVLYALRCAFAHEFGLFNPRKSPDPHNRLLRVSPDPSSPLVSWPRRAWDGTTANASNGTSTSVSLPRVNDLAEQVISSVRSHAQAGTLRPILPLGELRKRFGVGIR